MPIMFSIVSARRDRLFGWAVILLAAVAVSIGVQQYTIYGRSTVRHFLSYEQVQLAEALERPSFSPLFLQEAQYTAGEETVWTPEERRAAYYQEHGLDELEAGRYIEPTYTVERTVRPQGMPYAIEVIRIDLNEKLSLTANLYRPYQLSSKTPLLLHPLGCGSRLFQNTEVASPQKLAASFASAGAMVMVMGDLCDNRGFVSGDYVDESFAQGSLYTAGTPFQSSSISNLTWINNLDFLLSRYQFDQSKIAITGYSRGGQITRQVAALDQRIQYIAPVATRTRPYVPFEEFKVNPSNNSPYRFFYDPGTPRDVLASTSSTPFQRFQREGLEYMLLDRKDYHVVLAQEDMGTFESEMQDTLAFMRQANPSISASYEMIPGDHNYDASKRARVYEHLVPLLGLAQPQPEDSLPMLEAVELTSSADYLQQPLNDFYGQLAQEYLERSKSQVKGAADPDSLATLFRIGGRKAGTFVRLNSNTLGGVRTTLLRYDTAEGVSLPLVEVTPPNHKRTVLVLTSRFYPTDIEAAVDSGARVIVVPMLGLGPFRALEASTNNVSIRLNNFGSSFTALHVQILDDVLARYGKTVNVLQTNDTEAGILLTVYRALRPAVAVKVPADLESQFELVGQSNAPSPFLMVYGIVQVFDPLHLYQQLLNTQTAAL